MIDIKKCAERLERVRQSVPWTLAELAKEIGISYETLAKFYSGDSETQIRVLTMRKIKEFLEKYKHKKPVSKSFICNKPQCTIHTQGE